MSTFRLQIGSNEYTVSDIMHWNGIHEEVFVKEVLTLCKQWLSGEELFAIQTSGSTGAPKVIEISRTQITASALKSLAFFDLKAGDTVLCPLSMNVIGGKMMLFRSIIGGLIIHVIKPDRALSGMKQKSYHFMPISNLQLYEILLHHPSKAAVLNTFRHVLIGGGAVSEELEDLIGKMLTCNVWQSYGMTETVSHIALRMLSPNKESMYTLLNGLSIDTDARSCLKITGDVTKNQWIQTNDIVNIEDPTHFMFTGRADFVINSGGIKIHTEVLESLIGAIFKEQDITHEFFIAGIKDETYVEKVVLIMNDSTVQQEKILLLLKTCLPTHHAPKEVYSLPFIYTESGKINRKETLKQMNN